MKKRRLSWNYAAMSAFAFTAMSSTAVEAQTTVVGAWEGRAVAGNDQTSVALQIRRGDGELKAVLDLPDLGVRGWPARSAKLVHDSIVVSIESDAGVGVMSLQLRADQMVGEWREPGIKGPAVVTLNRVSSSRRRGLLRSDIMFESLDGTRLAGTIVMPDGPGPFPGLVFVHGSGPQPREASQFMAEEFARAGIAALIYDKRGVGESGGDWRTVGLEALAEDALAAANVLGAQDKVDSLMVGFQGQSQGGWIAPLAASYRPHTAFMVLVSGPWTTPAIEGHWSYVWQARQEGADAGVVDKITRHLLLRDGAVRSGAWDAYLEDVEQAKDEAWFSLAGLDPSPDPSAWYWEPYRLMLDFDPVPVFEQIETPLLALFGALDESIPALESARRLREMAGRLGKPFEAVVYEHANHALRITDVDGRRARWPGYPHGYVSRVAEWILEKTIN